MYLIDLSQELDQDVLGEDQRPAEYAQEAVIIPLLSQQDVPNHKFSYSEYAHKDIAISCLIGMLNQVTSKFKEFKSYRQRQKERALK
jgi:hypothetical protein